MKAKLKKIGKSQWVIIPNSIIAKLGRGKGLDMTVENNAIVLRKLDKPVRIVGADRVLPPETTLFGAMANSVKLERDIVSPLDNDWEACL